MTLDQLINEPNVLKFFTLLESSGYMTTDTFIEAAMVGGGVTIKTVLEGVNNDRGCSVDGQVSWLGAEDRGISPNGCTWGELNTYMTRHWRDVEEDF